MANLFLVTSRYTAPTDTIDFHLVEHRAWVDTLYSRGTFILSGRLAPPTGGFMLAREISRDELESLLATDPFRINDLLEHTITELVPTKASAAFADLVEQAR